MIGVSTKGVIVRMSTNKAVPTSTAVTGWGTDAADIQLTPSTVVKDDLVIFKSTDVSGKVTAAPYVVSESKTNTVTLPGLDHTGHTAAPAAVMLVTASDMVSLCLSNLTINADAGSTVSVGTFCNPGASIPSAIQEAGTIEMGGFIDQGADDYKALLAASQDGLTRYLYIKLPGNLGHLTTFGVLSRMNYEVPLDGALSCSLSLVMATHMEHRYT